MITKNEVPLWKKYALTLSEAAQYFGIGERKLQQIADDKTHLWGRRSAWIRSKQPANQQGRIPEKRTPSGSSV